MGTKSNTNQQTQFNPQGMGAYNSMQGPLAQTTNSYMQNPFGNPFMQTQQQMGNRQAQNQGGTMMNQITNNATGAGLMGGAGSPAAMEMMQNQGRANSGMQANLGFLQPMQNALGMQQNAMGLAENYRPLATGSNQQQSTSGLGTWLPQLLSGALGAASGGLGGLFGGGGGGGGFFGGANSGPSSPMPQSATGTFGGMGGGAFGEGMGAYGNPNSGPGGYGQMGMMPPPPMPGPGY
jgi:hypothetical protein